jgi:hypothetical protein
MHFCVAAINSRDAPNWPVVVTGAGLLSAADSGLASAAAGLAGGNRSAAAKVSQMGPIARLNHASRTGFHKAD